jgi:hypothetical protein
VGNLDNSSIRKMYACKFFVISSIVIVYGKFHNMFLKSERTKFLHTDLKVNFVDGSERALKCIDQPQRKSIRR